MCSFHYGSDFSGYIGISHDTWPGSNNEVWVQHFLLGKNTKKRGMMYLSPSLKCDLQARQGLFKVCVVCDKLVGPGQN